MTLDNCPRCGKLFAKNFRDVCPHCIREIDQEYERCAEYLRKNKGAFIVELSEETGVTIKQISKFVREGRISIADAPNMTYPCDSCGTMIRNSHLCDACRTRLVKDTNELRRTEDREKKLEQELLDKKKQIYKGLDSYKNRD
ncbi:TIGR03826 family flagellar region protein [Paenibacillus yanchengensis]|uniref:TIGR03826 family flagellar region protein n=1 Tax=Paenibacillus yanchengensis TaxID=2035833 RepID=A0ABW4YMW9_9BACL